jgi:ribA/ribD-fused uncharacterized protein
MADELKEFYKAKLKPKKGFTYGYDNDGNLVVRNKDEVIKTITLPVYRRPTMEEIKSMEERRNEAIALANRAVDDARTVLYEESKKPKEERDDATIVRLNRAVVEADSRLSMVRYPLTHIDKVYDIKIRELDFTQPNETRVLPYPVAFIETCPFTLQEQYVRIGAVAERPMISVAEAKNAIKMAEHVPVILFEGPDTNDYGYLSLQWAVVLEFNSTTYHSAYHAIYTELAKYFDDQIHLPQLLGAKTADEIDYSVNDVPGDLEQNKEKWNEKIRSLLYDVNLVKFNKYPELAVKLLETGNAMIGAYQPDDTLLGIGISIENPDAKDVSKWSENALGKVLMSIRDVLRSSSQPIAAPVEAPVEAPVSEAPIIQKKTKPKRSISSIAPAGPVAVPAEPVAVPAGPVVAPVEPVAVPAEPVAVPAEPVAVPAEPVAVAPPSQPSSIRVPRISGKPRIVRPSISESTKSE